MTAYYIGDPTSVLTDEQIAEGDFYSFPTAYGDGFYFDQFGNSHAVDSGCLACIEVDAITEVERLNVMVATGYAHIHEFEDLLACDCSCDDGFITFGGVVIDTN
jgi:hypothetical protein